MLNAIALMPTIKKYRSAIPLSVFRISAINNDYRSILLHHMSQEDSGKPAVVTPVVQSLAEIGPFSRVSLA